MALPQTLLSLGTLRKLTTQFDEPEFDDDYFLLAQTNTSLQELNISFRGNDVLSFSVAWRTVKVGLSLNWPFKDTTVIYLRDSFSSLHAKDFTLPPVNRRIHSSPLMELKFMHVALQDNITENSLSKILEATVSVGI
ncbi:MAG: hypothetical protein BYD32DRAFT_439890 [Podila humilis]|nr:MAG: hypothetical protein BYD32DRAFT_439890 [Podila humilis]